MAHGLAELTLHGSQLKFPCCEHLFFLNDFTLLQLVHTIFCRLFFVLLGSKLRALRLHGPFRLVKMKLHVLRWLDLRP